jgi:hypothetical protein
MEDGVCLETLPGIADADDGPRSDALALAIQGSTSIVGSSKFRGSRVHCV